MIREVMKSTKSVGGLLKVKPTLFRLVGEDDYQAQVTDWIAENVGSWGIVATKKPNDKCSKIRAVIAKIVPRRDVPDRQIRLDMTLRNALQVKKGQEVYLFGITEGPLHRRILDRLFRPKKIWAYAYRSIPTLMEKGLCGIGETTGRILGVQSRDRLLVEAVYIDPWEKRFKVGETSLPLLQLSMDELEHKPTDEGDRPDDGFSGLPIIRLDKDARIALANEGRGTSQNSEQTQEIPPLTPVRLSVSLPFFLETRATFYAAGVFLVLLVAILGIVSQKSMPAAIIGGLVAVIVVPTAVLFFDIRRIRKRVG